MGALTGQRIVVTRAPHQAEELAAPLRELGAEVIQLPTIAIAPPLDPEPLKLAASQCNAFDWIIFTSANAVAAFASELPQNPAACAASIATVGSATRAAARHHGFIVSITPETYVAESLVEAFHADGMAGLRMLIPSAAVTRDVVATELRRLGAEVSVVEAYRNVVPDDLPNRASAILREPYPDWITFTSSSSVDNLIRVTGTGPLLRMKIVTIGPITSETVRQHGLKVAIEAAVHSAKGIVTSLSSLVPGVIRPITMQPETKTQG